MKTLRCICAILLSVSIIFTVFFGAGKISEQTPIKKAEGYKGVITLWQVDGFEGGKGSRKQFLLKVARTFERQNQGVLIMVVNHTFTSVKENFDNGIYPDLLSFCGGVELKTPFEIKVKRATSGGKIGEKTYATPWCRGGYTLISNPEVMDNQADRTIIVSQSEYTNSLTAILLEEYKFKEYLVLKPMDAYVKFTQGKIKYFLGTQRDLTRLSNRGMEVESTPLTKFNDLYQYVALTGNGQDKKVYAQRFIEFLISDQVQSQLVSINMFSPFSNLSFTDQNLSAMQSISDFSTLSAFESPECLKELQRISLFALSGDQNYTNKIKNMLV